MTSFDRGGQCDLAMRQSQPDLMDSNKSDHFLQVNPLLFMAVLNYSDVICYDGQHSLNNTFLFLFFM